MKLLKITLLSLALLASTSVKAVDPATVIAGVGTSALSTLYFLNGIDGIADSFKSGLLLSSWWGRFQMAEILTAGLIATSGIMITKAKPQPEDDSKKVSAAKITWGITSLITASLIFSPYLFS